MSAHHLTIAKASFAAGLLRPDITKISRDDLNRFHHSLELAISQCSATNIQACKDWLLVNILPSTARTNAFGKYLASFSKHIQDDENGTEDPSLISGTRTRRKRLHILYLINDILHHSKYHTSNRTLHSDFTKSLEPYLDDLLQSFTKKTKPKVQGRVNELLKIWQTEQYISPTKIKDLYLLVSSEPSSLRENNEVKAKIPETKRLEIKETPYVMPKSHGDPSAQFYDLPAGNLMPHVMPNSSIPMRPDQIRALQFTPGPADEGLVTALKDFLKDVARVDEMDRIGDSHRQVTEIDELGQLSYRDEAGELIGDTYYGWSRAFCQKMKSRGEDGLGRPRRPRSRSISRSTDESPRKRRRYSDSVSSRSRSSTRSRSRSRNGKSSYELRGAQPVRRNASRSRSVSRGRNLTSHFQPTTTLTSQHLGYPPNSSWSAPPPPSHSSPASIPFGGNSVSHVLPPPPPIGANGLPIPPPRPQHWNGPWPPPPPPPMALNNGTSVPFPPHGLPPPPSAFPPGTFPPGRSGESNYLFPGRR